MPPPTAADIERHTAIARVALGHHYPVDPTPKFRRFNENLTFRVTATDPWRRGDPAGGPVILGMGKANQNVIMLLDIDRVLMQERMSVVEQTGHEGQGPC